jgi:flagellar motor switch protein FliM
MEPLKGTALFEIDPAITYAIIDIISGRKAGTTKPCRELTDDEEKLIKDIYDILLENIRQSWIEVSDFQSVDVLSVDLRPRLEKIAPDPKLIKLAPPSEMTALITLEVKIEEVQGMMNYCIPFPVIEPILEKVSAL